MKKLACILIALLPIITYAQDNTSRTEIIIKKEKEKLDYLSIRVGTWFPKDKEQGFQFKDVSYNNAKSSIDQSQALGLDFHYRNSLGSQLFVDFSVSGWYSTYSFKFNETLADPSLAQEASSWVVVVPITLGLSLNPLPDNPVQPYAMAGIGAYVGVTGREVTVNGQGRHITEDKSKVALGGYIGAGLDFFLTPGFGLSLGLKYQLVKFDEAMFTQQKDFTGLQVLLGITSAL